ncbi:MAG TPA: hypothetical protein VFB58_00195 [Chloroflexota bacterium]|nr:hypothetical protein [Chloroflexota bacterium]
MSLERAERLPDDTLLDAFSVSQTQYALVGSDGSVTALTDATAKELALYNYSPTGQVSISGQQISPPGAYGCKGYVHPDGTGVLLGLQGQVYDTENALVNGIMPLTGLQAALPATGAT